MRVHIENGRVIRDPVPDYEIMVIDGIAYAVFDSEWELMEFDDQFPHYFDQCWTTCCGGHMNAFVLGPLQ